MDSKGDSCKATKALQLIPIGCLPDGGCRGDLIREVKGQEARGVGAVLVSSKAVSSETRGRQSWIVQTP